MSVCMGQEGTSHSSETFLSISKVRGSFGGELKVLVLGCFVAEIWESTTAGK